MLILYDYKNLSLKTKNMQLINFCIKKIESIYLDIE